MPAQAGIQTSNVVLWMPACAGMTKIVLILVDPLLYIVFAHIYGWLTQGSQSAIRTPPYGGLYMNNNFSSKLSFILVPIFVFSSLASSAHNSDFSQRWPRESFNGNFGISSVSLSHPLDPRAIENKTRDSLENRIIETNTNDGMSDYIIDGIIKIRAPSTLHRKTQVNHWESANNFRSSISWTALGAGMASLIASGIAGANGHPDAAAATMIFSASSLAVSLFTGLWNAEAYMEVRQWSEHPAEAIADAHRNAYEQGFMYVYNKNLKMGAKNSTNGILQAKEVQYLYEKELASFYSEMLNRNLDLNGQWMTDFSFENPLSSNHIIYAYGQIPEHLQLVSRDFHKLEEILKDIKDHFANAKSSAKDNARAEMQAYQYEKEAALAPLRWARDQYVSDLQKKFQENHRKGQSQRQQLQDIQKEIDLKNRDLKNIRGIINDPKEVLKLSNKELEKFEDMEEDLQEDLDELKDELKERQAKYPLNDQQKLAQLRNEESRYNQFYELAAYPIKAYYESHINQIQNELNNFVGKIEQDQARNQSIYYPAAKELLQRASRSLNQKRPYQPLEFSQYDYLVPDVIKPQVHALPNFKDQIFKQRAPTDWNRDQQSEYNVFLNFVKIYNN
jgi:hypothetical protein